MKKKNIYIFIIHGFYQIEIKMYKIYFSIQIHFFSNKTFTEFIDILKMYPLKYQNIEREISVEPIQEITSW